MNNVLVIGDLHEPFSLDKYLEFCIAKYHEFDCTEVVFFGDVIKNHYSFYHKKSEGGLLVFAVLCAIAADPTPASLENAAR